MHAALILPLAEARLPHAALTLLPRQLNTSVTPPPSSPHIAATPPQRRPHAAARSPHADPRRGTPPSRCPQAALTSLHAAAHCTHALPPHHFASHITPTPPQLSRNAAPAPPSGSCPQPSRRPRATHQQYHLSSHEALLPHRWSRGDQRPATLFRGVGQAVFCCGQKGATGRDEVADRFGLGGPGVRLVGVGWQAGWGWGGGRVSPCWGWSWGLGRGVDGGAGWGERDGPGA